MWKLTETNPARHSMAATWSERRTTKAGIGHVPAAISVSIFCRNVRAPDGEDPFTYAPAFLYHGPHCGRPQPINLATVPHRHCCPHPLACSDA